MLCQVIDLFGCLADILHRMLLAFFVVIYLLYHIQILYGFLVTLYRFKHGFIPHLLLDKSLYLTLRAECIWPILLSYLNFLFSRNFKARSIFLFSLYVISASVFGFSNLLSRIVGSGRSWGTISIISAIAVWKSLPNILSTCLHIYMYVLAYMSYCYGPRSNTYPSISLLFPWTCSFHL